ncbi:MAG: aminotransferase class I/II-fold pyridoxal phosphate-dependent enzyme [Prolixibacteraceae bacterium]|nr:aminotransferase class I/II-fold pyridoxal phosphate-dependent enzyme [Prolixibacteraceae bacterium]
MNPQAEDLNQIIRENNPAVYELLSKKGKNVFFPTKGILGQSADARGTKINATIGIAKEDDGTPMRLDCIEKNINIDPSKVFPYAPSFGRPDIRKEWEKMICKKNPGLKGKELSLPIVTSALTHGVSMLGYMFVNEGDRIILPDLFWGNYNLILQNGYGAVLQKFNFFKDKHIDLDAIKSSLEKDGIGKKILILNFPNNPSGYSPTIKESEAIAAILKESAQKGNKIIVICDDAYFGLLYEDGISQESIFSYLADLDSNILAIKVDGATKEDYVWGFRVGFITYGIKGGDKNLYAALESKTAGAIRGNISNAPNISQSLLMSAYENPDYDKQKQAKYEILKSRYTAVKEALKEKKYSKYFNPLPFNSGYFMCINLAEGIDGEKLRELLIKKYNIGVINMSGNIRLAFSAVPQKDIHALFEGIYQACKELKK